MNLKELIVFKNAICFAITKENNDIFPTKTIFGRRKKVEFKFFTVTLFILFDRVRVKV